MSTLYGSGAIGGVINMVTKKGAGAPAGGGYAEIGTRLTTSAGAYMFAAKRAERFNYNISATEAALCPGRVGRPAPLHAAGRLRRSRCLSQRQPRVAAGLRHQRQEPIHLVQPLHRHPREIRPGRPGRPQRHGIHAAVLQSPPVRRQLLQRPVEADGGHRLQHRLSARSGLPEPPGAGGLVLLFAELQLQRPDVHRRLEERVRGQRAVQLRGRCRL